MRAAVVSATFTMLLAAFSFLAQFCGPAFATDCGPTGITCLQVGESASVTVTNHLLGLQCLTQDLKPDHELITLGSNVQPAVAGRPKVTFGAPTIIAYEAGTTATVSTTLQSKPGQYTITLRGTGADCGPYPGFTWYFWIIPKIIGDTQVWMFGGPKPAGYETEITLTALPPNQPPYKWDLTYGKEFMRFPNGGAFITTMTNQVKVHGIKPSDGEGPSSVAVGVGLHSLGHIVTVRSPKALDLVGFREKADANRGYVGTPIYRIVDQLGHSLPKNKPIPWNIVWSSSAPDELFHGTNWLRPLAGPHDTTPPNDLRFNIFPKTLGGHPVVDGIPRAQAPHNGTLKVDCWAASVFVGSEEPRKGILVDRQIWLRYQDHLADAAACPP